jgi:hypothetical protein
VTALGNFIVHRGGVSRQLPMDNDPRAPIAGTILATLASRHDSCLSYAGTILATLASRHDSCLSCQSARFLLTLEGWHESCLSCPHLYITSRQLQNILNIFVIYPKVCQTAAVNGTVGQMRPTPTIQELYHANH